MESSVRPLRSARSCIAVISTGAALLRLNKCSAASPMTASIANRSSPTRIRLFVVANSRRAAATNSPVVDLIAERHSLALQHSVGEERFDELAGERAGGLAARTRVLKHHGEGDAGTVSRSVAREPGMIGLSAAGLGGAALSCDRDLCRADGVVGGAGGGGHGLGQRGTNSRQGSVRESRDMHPPRQTAGGVLVCQTRARPAGANGGGQVAPIGGA